MRDRDDNRGADVRDGAEAERDQWFALNNGLGGCHDLSEQPKDGEGCAPVLDGNQAYQKALERSRDAQAARVSGQGGQGSRIFYGSGAFRPSGVAGRRLMVHELTHVVRSELPLDPTDADR